MLNKILLDGVQAAIALLAFDGGDSLAIVHRCQGHAGQNSPAVDVDGARAAFPARKISSGQSSPAHHATHRGA